MEIIAGSRGFVLRQIDISLAAATASIYQLGRPAAKGITPTSPVLIMPEASGDPSTLLTGTALAWATPPTVPTYFYRSAQMAAVVGQSISWTGLNIIVGAGMSIVLWNGAANSAAQVNVIIDE